MKLYAENDSKYCDFTIYNIIICNIKLKIVSQFKYLHGEQTHETCPLHV